MALQSAKARGSTHATYSTEDTALSVEQVTLVGELRRAIERGELVLHYQRQVQLSDQEVIGYEALVRWRHPERGLLEPLRFVPLAERTGLARPLFEWVLRTALCETKDWGTAQVAISVNLSVRNLLDPDLPGLVERELSAAGRPASQLTLEVTEGVVMADPERAVRVLERLRALGVMISMDDFGTGYSSMAYLQSLPLDELKIDKTFLKGLPRNARNVAIVRATIDLARGLGIKTLAEGVEDASALSALVTLGCDRAQGFHFGRPVPASSLDPSLPPPEESAATSAAVTGTSTA